jgi:hypothetical protein
MLTDAGGEEVDLAVYAALGSLAAMLGCAKVSAQFTCFTCVTCCTSTRAHILTDADVCGAWRARGDACMFQGTSVSSY